MGKLKNLKFWVFAIICAVIIAPTINRDATIAAESPLVGTGIAKFLRIGLGSRAAGMGGAYVGVSDNVDAIFWNPAGLSQLTNREFGLTYMQWFEDIMCGVIAYGHPLPKGMGAIGINLLYWNMGTIEKTTDGTNYTSASVTQGAGGISYSIAMMRNLLLFGATIKGIYQDLAGNYMNGIAGDAGILFRLSKDINLGLSLQNIGPVYKQDGSIEILPDNIKAGVAFRPGGKGFMIAVDVDKPSDNDPKFHAGAEYYFEKFALRVGYNQAEATSAKDASAFSGFTAGLGFKGGVGEESTEAKLKVEADYAYIPYGTLGTTHRLTVILKF